MRYIIFGYDGRNTLGQIRSLGVKGVRPTIILVGPRKGICEASRYCGQICFVSSEGEGIELLLSEFADSKDKAVVYTDSDGVVGAMNACYDSLSPYFCFSNAGEKNKLNSYLEKYCQIQLAKNVGFTVADTKVWKKGEPTPELTYPVFTKAVSSLKNGWKKGSHICKNENELQNVLDATNQDEIESLILQQFIEKKDEIHFEGFSINKGSDVYIPLYGGYYRLEETSYGTYEWLASCTQSDLFLKQIKQLFQEIGYEGIFEVEFILDKQEKLYFTEINFRETAFNHIHTLMGVNITWMYAQSLAKGRLCTEEAKVIKEPFVFMNEFADFSHNVLSRKISIIQWVVDVRNCDAFIFYDRQDYKPFRNEFKKFSKWLIKVIFKKIFKVNNLSFGSS